jgi:hypothetical protein
MKLKILKMIPVPVLEWLSESSTWRGIILVCTALGMSIGEDTARLCVALGLAAVGMINIVRRETVTHKRKKKKGKPRHKYPRK